MVQVVYASAEQVPKGQFTTLLKEGLSVPPLVVSHCCRRISREVQHCVLSLYHDLLSHVIYQEISYMFLVSNVDNIMIYHWFFKGLIF